MKGKDTKDQILTAARRLAQSRGYHALSFRDLATEVGIKSASIHYHFPTKADLGVAIARQYTAELAAHLAQASGSTPGLAERIRAYTTFFRNTLLQDNRMCLGGFMAAERDELPPPVADEVLRFAETILQWLTAQLDAAAPTEPTHRARALAIFAAVAGAQLIARGRGSVAVFDSAIASYREAGLLP